MESYLEYKGYFGNVNFDKLDKIFYGKVIGITSYLSYEGKNIYLLKRAFCQVIEDYNTSLLASTQKETAA